MEDFGAVQEDELSVLSHSAVSVGVNYLPLSRCCQHVSVTVDVNVPSQCVNNGALPAQAVGNMALPFSTAV